MNGTERDAVYLDVTVVPAVPPADVVLGTAGVGVSHVGPAARPAGQPSEPPPRR